MPLLRETQMAFASSVLGVDAQAMQGLVQEHELSTEERLRIYRNNARIGFHQALRAAFPVIEQLGGNDWFESVAQRYQLHHPSRRGDLQYVGDRFAQFLQSDLAGTDYEWFAAVAQLEWAYQEVLVAAESPVLDPAVLSTLSSEQQERVVFVPRSALRLVHSQVPVLDIWKAHQPGAELGNFTLDAVDQHVLIIRRHDHVELREIPATQATVLALFESALPLEAVQMRLTERFPEADLGAALVELARLRCLSSIHIPNPLN